MAALFEDQRQITEMQICFTPITPTHTSEVSLLGRHFFFKDLGGHNNQVSFFFIFFHPSGKLASSHLKNTQIQVTKG